jgi:hypothetical protein
MSIRFYPDKDPFLTRAQGESQKIFNPVSHTDRRRSPTDPLPSERDLKSPTEKTTLASRARGHALLSRPPKVPYPLPSPLIGTPLSPFVQKIHIDPV